MNDTTITITRLLTDKLALNHSRIDTQAMPLPLAQGEALLKISRVAITTNNITYAGALLRLLSDREPLQTVQNIAATAAAITAVANHPSA